MTDTKEIPRLVISAAIMAYFGYAIFAHWTTGIEETVKNTTMLAVGYWLGSSKGAADSGARTDKSLDLLKSAQDGPQPVVVTNDIGAPIPTTTEDK